MGSIHQDEPSYSDKINGLSDCVALCAASAVRNFDKLGSAVRRIRRSTWRKLHEASQRAGQERRGWFKMVKLQKLRRHWTSFNHFNCFDQLLFCEEAHVQEHRSANLQFGRLAWSKDGVSGNEHLWLSWVSFTIKKPRRKRSKAFWHLSHRRTGRRHYLNCFVRAMSSSSLPPSRNLPLHVRWVKTNN